MTIHTLTIPEAVQSLAELAAEIYRDDPWHTPCDPTNLSADLSRERYAGHQRITVATRKVSLRAGVVARINRDLPPYEGKAIGMLGSFEAQRDPVEVQALLADACAWLRGRGAGMVIGPIDGDTWHGYRLNVGPYEDPPFLMEPYNPPYYPDLWAGSGFEVLESYYSKSMTSPRDVATGTGRIADRARSNGYTLRPIDLDRFDAELQTLYRLTCGIFADNFLYSEISFDEFATLYRKCEKIIDPRLVRFACSPEGQDIGFVFALRDIPADSRAASDAPTLNVKTLGVLPAHQRTGVALLLMNHVYLAAHDLGFGRVNLCLIRDGNPSGRLDANQGTVFRRYHLYKLKRSHT